MLSLLKNERGNWSLVGLLVALAVGFLIYFTVLMPKMDSGKKAEQEGLIKPKGNQTVVGASMDKAKETSCSSNLRQVRMLVDQAYTQAGQYPSSLESLERSERDSPKEMGTPKPVAEILADISCPASGQPYNYDPSKGTVSCSTQGHEKL